LHHAGLRSRKNWYARAMIAPGTDLHPALPRPSGLRQCLLSPTCIATASRPSAMFPPSPPCIATASRPTAMFSSSPPRIASGLTAIGNVRTSPTRIASASHNLTDRGDVLSCSTHCLSFTARQCFQRTCIRLGLAAEAMFLNEPFFLGVAPSVSIWTARFCL